MPRKAKDKVLTVTVSTTMNNTLLKRLVENMLECDQCEVQRVTVDDVSTKRRLQSTPR